MPATLTYPGVYIEEIPSGVRTITGVSTSVTAFVGSANRGPINKAIHILSFSDYERRFGGLGADSEMSYAVHQFFLNGGRDAWVVRLAKNPSAAFWELSNSDSPVLKITALDEGATGNNIEVRVDYQTDNPANTLNLTLNYRSADNPADNLTETFQNLSLNSKDPRYAPDLINGISRLVTAERLVEQGTLNALPPGTSTSAKLVEANGTTPLDVAKLIDPTHNQFQIAVNGLPPVKILIKTSDYSGNDRDSHLANLCAAIEGQVQAEGHESNVALGGFTCSFDTINNQIKMTSGEGGEFSSVCVLPGMNNDVSVRLKLGAAGGGIEADAVATIRPVEIPDRGALTSGSFSNGDFPAENAIPSPAKNSLQISLDGGRPVLISLGETPAAGDTLLAKLNDVASRLQKQVRASRPSDPAFRDFTCAPDSANAGLLLNSGSRGKGSSVVVTAAERNSIASELHLLANTTATQPSNKMLANGSESLYGDSEAYSLFIADRSQRKGIFALEAVDLFNLLCLPGATDSGILSDAAAYCRERRAFLIADPPRSAKTPDEMVGTISGTALPKTEYGAVYYPWIQIADPLKNGKLRTSAPCGAVAGLYARTDSTRGVWKAPAGTDATLVGVQGVDYLLTDGENGTLNPLGVNCIRIFPIYGALAWGARTLRGADQIGSEYKYVPIRRLALFLEESLYRGTKWAVFEPNDEPLWAQIRLNIGAFMQNLFRQGAFQGKSPREAYFVKCDRETTTQNDINLGIVNIVVGFAPLKPAEFVIIKLQQMAGQIEV